jgi:hypothetical protein
LLLSTNKFAQNALDPHGALTPFRAPVFLVDGDFNPLHRDLNRGDQRMLWNAIINWQAIVARH